MVANILNSPRAVAMSVYVIRAFVKMRGELAANAAILKRLAEIDKTLLIHDVALREIFEKLRPLLGASTCPAQARNRLPRQRRPRPLPRREASKGLNKGRDFRLWTLDFGLFSSPAYHSNPAKKPSRSARKTKTATT